MLALASAITESLSALREAERLIAAPPCERRVAASYLHPRFPSGDCVACGALCTEGCRHQDYEAWERQQT